MKKKRKKLLLDEIMKLTSYRDDALEEFIYLSFFNDYIMLLFKT
jgi:hypothetical protein